MELLTSPQNPRVKHWAALKERKRREETGLYAAEGLLLVREYLDAGAPIETLLLDTLGAKGEAALELAERAQTRGIAVVELTSAVFARVADTDHPQGALAIVRMPEMNLEDELNAAATQGGNDCANVVLVADGVRDPGNLGTMLRTAQAVGCRVAIVTEGSVDPFHPKVVRASMGALARLAVARLSAQTTVRRLEAAGFALFGADARAPRTLFQTELRSNIALAVGAEVDGLSSEMRAACAQLFSLPMPGGAESLNAGAASAAVLYEALRQRLA